MKEVKKCIVENCIPSPVTCVDWNGGDIDFLGICDGDKLHNVIWEIILKLQKIAGEDLSGFDLDGVLAICNQKAPSEVSLLTILRVLRDNNLCLKDYIDTLSEQLAELSKEQGVNVNLKCYQDFDNLGNALKISRDQLDQLVINRLCAHDDSLESLQGQITNLREELDEAIGNRTVEEPLISTCVDGTEKATSLQVKSVATAHCELEEATGSPSAIASAMGMIPTNWNTLYSTLVGWKSTVTNEAELISNMVLIIQKQGTDIKYMQDNCCAADCDSVKIGFAVTFDGSTAILTFSNSAGLKLPAGFTDKGSTGTITDVDGVSEPFNIAIAEGASVEVSLATLNTNDKLYINLNSKVGNDSLLCEKCVNKTAMMSSCGVCEISASGPEGSSAVLIYYDDSVLGAAVQVSTTTTTTAAPSTTTTTTTLP